MAENGSQEIKGAYCRQGFLPDLRLQAALRMSDT